MKKANNNLLGESKAKDSKGQGGSGAYSKKIVYKKLIQCE